MLTIATCTAYPEPPANLLPLLHMLAARGIRAHAAPWQSRPQTPFILPLCAWDYAAEPQAFSSWLDEAAEAGSRFANPPALMRWNMDKRYLIDLSEKGVHVIPSRALPAEEAPIRETVRRHGWHTAVIKPLVGQSGRGVEKFVSDGPLPDLRQYPQGVLVQPYLQDIETEGEISMIFIGGTFSHAVKRQPKAGEWRANSAYGVQVFPHRPSETALAAARRALSALPQTPLYARIDGTFRRNSPHSFSDGLFALNELELIEPALYPDTAPDAVPKLADALAQWIRAV
ncbi:RimK family alpha-L-glutamate ligase [Neisseria dentiae]|uniref:ATP-grasp domain-containing protein n=1 Tax=Neisseria dentiae TaxID=194197 RepID=UPI0035A06B75